MIFFLRGWDVLLNLMPSGATGVTSPVLFAGESPFLWGPGALVPAVSGAWSTVRRDVS